jgi:anti-sigma factor RsiW
VSKDKIDALLEQLKHRPSTSTGMAASPCPDETQLAAYLDDTLPEADVKRIQAHLADCPLCRQVIIACAKLNSPP